MGIPLDYFLFEHFMSCDSVLACTFLHIASTSGGQNPPNKKTLQATRNAKAEPAADVVSCRGKRQSQAFANETRSRPRQGSSAFFQKRQSPIVTVRAGSCSSRHDHPLKNCGSCLHVSLEIEIQAITRIRDQRRTNSPRSIHRFNNLVLPAGAPRAPAGSTPPRGPERS